MKNSMMFAALLGATMVAGTAHAQNAGGPGAALAAADANNDGVITKDELLADSDKRFADLDKNKDGKIAADERPQGGQGGGGGGGGGLGRADTDGDGAISQAEMRASTDQRFARMDANSDGKIDATEMQNMRGRGPGGGGNGSAPAPATPSGN